MDYQDPVSAMFGGVRGRVLSMLSRTDAPLTLRQVAERANASHPQVSAHIEQLVHLGLVERTVVGRGHLVRLNGSAAADWLRNLASLTSTVMEHLELLASRIRPQPLSMVVFGSFARGEAGPDSDIDVVVVAPRGHADDARWLTQVDEWVARASAFASLPVVEMVWAEEDLPRHRRRPLWKSIQVDGHVVAGSPLR